MQLRSFLLTLLSVAAVRIQSADIESLEKELIQFYNDHVQTAASLDGEKLRSHLLSPLATDAELERIFLKHADLAKQKRNHDKAELKAASAERLRKIRADILARGAVVSIKRSDVPDILTAVLREQGVLKKDLVTMSLDVEAERGFSITKEYAHTGKRWVIMPDIAAAIRNRNLRTSPQTDINAFQDTVIQNATALAKELDSGIDPNARSKDAYKEPLLWRAVRLRATDSAKLLLNRGARVDERSAALKKTALFQAAYDGSIEIAKLLLDHGADPNALDIYGNNSLREAIYGKRAGMVRLLLQRGSDPNQINKDGESMKDIAAKHGTAEIQTILAAKSGGQ